MSFGLTPDKLIVIAAIAVFLIGPDRLPSYAAQFARIVKSLRGLADQAQARLREEVGPEYDTIDWSSLDPRRYDPRQIIADALREADTQDRATTHEP